MVKVLFVCMGNICRSPTAEAVFRQLIRSKDLETQIEIDSAGTIDHHTGEAPDRRAQETAQKFDLDLSRQKARQIRLEDFDNFQYILVMDRENMNELKKSYPDQDLSGVGFLAEYAHNHDVSEVPDPYYGGASGFENVFTLVQDASEGLLDSIMKSHFQDHAS